MAVVAKLCKGASRCIIKEETRENMGENERLIRADKLYTQHRLQEALAEYQAEVADDPENAWAYNRIGAILAQEGDEAGAEGALARALELDPELPQAHSNLGNLFYARGQYEQALEKYKQALALNPENPVFHENLHAAYKKLGKMSEAVAALKQAHKTARQSAQAESKAAVQHMSRQVKGRLGCLSTLVIIAIVISVVLVVIM